MEVGLSNEASQGGERGGRETQSEDACCLRGSAGRASCAGPLLRARHRGRSRVPQGHAWGYADDCCFFTEEDVEAWGSEQTCQRGTRKEPEANSELILEPKPLDAMMGVCLRAQVRCLHASVACVSLHTHGCVHTYSYMWVSMWGQ